MTDLSDKNIAVIIPARNEAERIGACLSALSGQWPHRVVVVPVSYTHLTLPTSDLV